MNTEWADWNYSLHFILDFHLKISLWLRTKNKNNVKNSIQFAALAEINNSEEYQIGNSL